MKKLYNLYPKGRHYPVKKLLEYNGITINSDDDDVKIATPLKRLAQIEIVEHPAGIKAKLTEIGVKAVEDFLIHNDPPKESVKQTDYFIEEKLNSVVDELNKLGLVNDTVFNEINDLRQLSTKLPPKQFREVILGKLVDIGVQESVKNDTLKLIYERLTDHEVVFQ